MHNVHQQGFAFCTFFSFVKVQRTKKSLPNLSLQFNHTIKNLAWKAKKKKCFCGNFVVAMWDSTGRTYCKEILYCQNSIKSTVVSLAQDYRSKALSSQNAPGAHRGYNHFNEISRNWATGGVHKQQQSERRCALCILGWSLSRIWSVSQDFASLSSGHVDLYW